MRQQSSNKAMPAGRPKTAVERRTSATKDRDEKSPSKLSVSGLKAKTSATRDYQAKAVNNSQMKLQPRQQKSSPGTFGTAGAGISNRPRTGGRPKESSKPAWAKNGNADIEDCFSQPSSKKQKNAVLSEKQAAILIQRAYRKMQQHRLMVLAEQAINMTNDIMDQRRNKLVKNNVYGRDSLDEEDVFKFRNPGGVANQNFSAFSAFEEPKLVVDERLEEDFPESSQKAVESSVVDEEPIELSSIGSDVYKFSMEPKKAVENLTKPNKSTEKSQSIDQPTDRDLSLSETSNQDDTFLNESQLSETIINKSQGPNKLAELNAMLKNKEFQIQKEDEDDFDQFISRLHKERSSKKSESQTPNTQRTPARSVIEEQKVEEQSEQLSESDPFAFKINLPTKGQGAAALLKHMEQVVRRDEEKKQKQEEKPEQSSFYTTFSKDQSPQKKFIGITKDDKSPNRYDHILKEEEPRDIDVEASFLTEEFKTERSNKSKLVDQSELRRIDDDHNQSDYLGPRTHNDAPLTDIKQKRSEKTQSKRESSPRSINFGGAGAFKEQEKSEFKDKSSVQSRYDQFMNFLDNIDDQFQPPREESVYSTSTKQRDEGVKPREAFNKVKERMMELEIEREETSKALETVKQLREKDARELAQRVLKEKEDGRQQVDDVKADMAGRIEKQVQMIEDLLADKKALSTKVEEMVGAMKDSHHQSSRQQKVIEDRFAVELRKNKDAWVSSEKVRREKWEREKIAEIRAQTVKGLEPEIQRIVERNKDELRKAHDLHQVDIRNKKDELSNEADQKVSTMRERLIKEKEDALDKERDRTQTKLHEQYERLEKQFEDERKRWKENVYDESTRVEAMLKHDNDRLKEEIRIVKDRAQEEVLKESQYAQDKVDAATRKHQIEMKTVREKIMIEQEEWKAEILKKAQDGNIESQRRLKEEMVRERNREIEAIIEKLGDETHSTQKQLMCQYEKKCQKVEDKHRLEIQEYRNGMDSWKEKYVNSQETRDMLDENVRVLSRRLNDMELEITDKNEKIKKTDRIHAETNAKLDTVWEDQERIRLEMEQKMRARLEESSREITMLKEQARSASHKTECEIEVIREQNKNELEMIQEKVAAAMNKKKETIEQLADEVRLKDLQVIKLKEMMDKQRRDLLR